MTSDAGSDCNVSVCCSSPLPLRRWKIDEPKGETSEMGGSCTADQRSEPDMSGMEALRPCDNTWAAS